MRIPPLNTMLMRLVLASAATPDQEDVLFMDMLDVSSSYGLLLPRANAVVPNSTFAPPPADYQAGVLVIATLPSLSKPGVFEVFVENTTGWEPLPQHGAKYADNPPPPFPNAGVQLLRFTTMDFRRYSEPELVLDLPMDDEGSSSLKSIARDDSTGRYVMFTTKTSPKAGYASFISLDEGKSWNSTTCDKKGAKAGCVRHPDKDDLNLIWNKGRFVDMQIVWRQNVSGMRYCDSDPCNIARAITAKTSSDGINWSADLGMRLPDVGLDPPDLQFYRIRPFYIGNTSRIAAHVLQYSPQPPQSVVGMHYGRSPPRCKNSSLGFLLCHGPHIHEEWWLGPASGDASAVHEWRRPYRHTHAAPNDAFLMSQPVTLSVQRYEQHLWIGSGQVYTLPLYRIAGLYSPSNAEIITAPITVPADSNTPIALNADVSWNGRLVTGGCDEGCAAYAFVELLNVSTNKPLPGFDRYAFETITDADGLRLPLRWATRTSTGTPDSTADSSADGTGMDTIDSTAVAGAEVRVLVGFRDATVYALMLGSA